MKIAQDVMEVLSAAEADGNVLKLGSGQLDRKLYTAVNKVLESIGGKWNTKQKGHVFNEDVADLIDDILSTGEYRNVKTDLQQFDTPDGLSDTVVGLAQFSAGLTVYEPSCGDGRGLIQALRRKAFELGSMNIFANEIDPKRFEIAKANYFIAGGITNKDFLTIEPSGNFDRVVMNPPFTKGQDIAHILHAHKFLKPGGLLVSIMAAGINFRQDRKHTEFRKFVDDMGGEFHQVDAGAFQESGTMVRTAIVVIPAP